jgi:hypothetical protein
VSSIVSSINCMDGRESWTHEIHKGHEPSGAGQEKGQERGSWGIRTRL